MDIQTDTEWQNPAGCLICVGYFPQKNPTVSGSFAKRDLQLKASYASAPLCGQRLAIADACTYIHRERKKKRKKETNMDSGVWERKTHTHFQHGWKWSVALHEDECWLHSWRKRILFLGVSIEYTLTPGFNREVLAAFPRQTNPIFRRVYWVHTYSNSPTLSHTHSCTHTHSMHAHTFYARTHILCTHTHSMHTKNTNSRWVMSYMNESGPKWMSHAAPEASWSRAFDPYNTL